MIQFRSYPIYVNNSDLYPEYLDQYSAATANLDYKKKAELDNQRFWMEIQEVPSGKQTGAMKFYERKIIEKLEGLLITDVGRVLFDKLLPNEKIWIVPNTLLTNDHYSFSQIYTFQNPPYQGGGIRIHFNIRKSINTDQENPYQLLFHELVHAYRYGVTKNNMNNSPFVITWGGDQEEVFATIMQNIYLSEIQEPTVYYSYLPTLVTTPDEAYKKLAFDNFSLAVLTCYLNYDPLAKLVARLDSSIYNPWRDYFKILQTARGGKSPNIFQ